MAVAFRSESGDNNFVTGTFSVAEPASAAQNDILVYLSLIDHGNTLTPPSGWTTKFSGPIAGGFTDYVLAWCVRGASAPNLTWTGSGSYTHEIYVLSFSGADTSSAPTGAQTTSAPGTNPDPPSVAGSAGGMVIAIGYNGNGATWTAPAGYTIQAGGTSNGVMATKAIAATGPENPGAFTGAIADNIWAASLSIAPSLAVTSAPLQWISGG